MGPSPSQSLVLSYVTPYPASTRLACASMFADAFSATPMVAPILLNRREHFQPDLHTYRADWNDQQCIINTLELSYGNTYNYHIIRDFNSSFYFIFWIMQRIRVWIVDLPWTSFDYYQDIEIKRPFCSPIINGLLFVAKQVSLFWLRLNSMEWGSRFQTASNISNGQVVFFSSSHIV